MISVCGQWLGLSCNEPTTVEVLDEMKVVAMANGIGIDVCVLLPVSGRGCGAKKGRRVAGRSSRMQFVGGIVGGRRIGC